MQITHNSGFKINMFDLRDSLAKHSFRLRVQVGYK